MVHLRWHLTLRILSFAAVVLAACGLAAYAFYPSFEGKEALLSPLSQESDQSQVLSPDTNATKLARGLVVHIAFKKITIELDVILPRQDDRGTRLLTGQVSFPDFINEVFGDLKVRHPLESPLIDEYSMCQLFIGVAPDIRVDQDLIMVKASSNSKNQISLPALSGTVQVDLPRNFATSPNDRFVIQVEDYEVESMSPPPAHWHDPYWKDLRATWTPQGFPSDSSPKIVVRVRYQPLNGGQKFLHFIQFNPIDIVPYPASIIFEVLYGLLLSIPIGWFLWLIRGLPEAGNRAFRFCAILLGGICFMAASIDLILAKSDLVTPLIERLGLRLPSFVLPFALTILVLSLILSAVAMFALRPSKQKALPFIAVQLIWLLLIAVMMAVLVVAVLLALYSQSPSRDRLWPALVGGIFILISLIVPYWFYMRRLASNKSAALKILIVLSPLPALLIALYALAGRVNNTFWFFTSGDLFQFSVLKISYLSGYMQDLASYVLFVAVLSVLSTLKGPTEDSRRIEFERFLFASFVVGITPYFYLIPIPFLLAFLIYPRIMLQGEERKALNREDKLIQSESAKDLPKVDLDLLRESLESVKNKFGKGEISIKQYERDSASLQKLIDKSEQRHLILATGPFPDDWENANHAAKYGVWLAVPFLPIYFGISLIRETAVPRFAILSLAVITLVNLVDFVILAFFFGYSFKYIRGSSGLRKGVYLAVAYSLCLLPIWMINLSFSFVALILFVLPNFIFLPLLGVCAFDLPKLRGERNRWKTLVQLEELPAFLAFSSVPVTSLALALVSFLTGGYKDVIAVLVKLAATAVPTLPQK